MDFSSDSRESGVDVEGGGSRGGFTTSETHPLARTRPSRSLARRKLYGVYEYLY